MVVTVSSSVLLIDDTPEVLASLAKALRAEINDNDVEIRKWCPSADDGDVRAKFDELVDETTVLVVTDYDLTKGMRGFFGLTVVGWCQQNSIPVGDFSRNTNKALPKEPNLFEFRIPSDDEEAARFIASTFKGFRELRRRLDEDESIASKRSLAAVLAAVLGKPQIESQFALYMSRLGSANSSLLEKLRDFAGPQEEPSTENKKRLLAYVLGHVLFNAILKYPGPILSEKALCAYIATSEDEIQSVSEVFEDALYVGPFDRNACFFWRDAIDEKIDKLGAALDEEDFEMFSDLNRRVVEKKLSRELKNHGCYRCEGTKGGFWCPFTQRPVCLRANCSVAASSWIPLGAQLCRVEKDFYDEWAPLLGL
jgi:hypothetical protein